MTFDELFDQRGRVALKLKECIHDKGYTKVSFTQKSGISRPTLDKLLSGSIDSKTTLKMLCISVDELMFYSAQQRRSGTVVYSQNAPEKHEMSSKARKQYELLLDIVELCAIYY